MASRSKTPTALRRALQRAPGSLRAVAAQYGVDVKTVMRWRARKDVKDRPRGVRVPSAMTLREEVIAVFVRRHTLLPLDDCLYALQPGMPHLTRASLYRCLRRHGVAKLPEGANAHPEAGGLGALRIDVGRIRSGEGEVYLLFAIDLKSKLMYGEVARVCDWAHVQRFLNKLARVFPYSIVSMVAPAGAPFGAEFRSYCRARRIVVLKASPAHSWSAAQIAKMEKLNDLARGVEFYPNRRTANASVQSFHDAYNFGRKLKALKGMTPFEHVRRAREAAPHLFRADPLKTVPRAALRR